MSFWSRAFSCCIRARPYNTKPHERTPLIAEGQIPTVQEPRVIDHQKMKERLGEIVRNKEGKMVNVNVQIPFNLHNQPVGVGGNASSSRSARRSPSGGANTSSSTQNSRAASPSPSLLITGSIASLPSFEVEPRQPILNVRLVRGVGRGRASRSRVRGRLGRHGEEGGREMHVDNGESPEAEPTHVDGAAAHDDPDDLQTPLPPRWAAHQDASGEAANDQSKTPQFTIQNTGVISRSWGD